MPFNGSGTFTIINTFIPNTTILSSAVNANFSDIATGLSDCLTRDGQAGMTAAIKAISGNAGSPSITFTSDASTGIYLESSGNLAFATDGIKAFRLDNFQNALFGAAAEAFVFLTTGGLETISSNINTLATSGTGLIAVGTGSDWPAKGYLKVGSELMSYATASAGGLTITQRGIYSSTAVSHATGSTLDYVFSGFSLENMLLPNRGNAGRPSNPGPGEFGFNTDTSQLEVFNGTVWQILTQPQIKPQGYLSPVAGNPIIGTDETSQTTLYYNPYEGNVIPIPTNGVFNLNTFATSAIALSASQTTNGIYDIYGFISTTNSTLTFGISPSWAAGSGGSVAPGSCARGTGAGGTALVVVNGLPTNATTMTLLNGANSYSIATSSGIYLGSVYIGATAGTVNLHRVFGQNRQWGIWNAFNSVPVFLKAGESTSTWTYTTSTVRPSNNTTANSLTIFSGLATDVYELEFLQMVSATAGGQARVGLGVNETTAVFGFSETLNGATITKSMHARYYLSPQLGVNVITSLESGATGTTFSGTENSTLLTALWRV